MHYGSHNLSSQEKEFAWLLETEFDVKLDAMSRCMEVLETIDNRAYPLYYLC